MAREYCLIVQESAYGTPAATLTIGTNAIFIRLDQANAMAMRMKPVMAVVPYGGGLAIDTQTVCDLYETKGALSTILYPSQASFLLGWSGLRINAGQTSPWTTTEPVGDLASCSVYHAKQLSDGTYSRKWYPGCKVAGWKLNSSRDQKLWRLTLDLVAQQVQGNSVPASLGGVATDPSNLVFPAPTDAQYPTGPFVYANVSGGLTLDGTARTMFDEITLSSQNVLDIKPFESAFPQIIRFLGRKTTLEAKLLLKPTPWDRGIYEAITAGSGQLVISNGTHSVTANMNAQGIFENLDDDLPLDKVFEETVTWKAQYDPAAGADLSLSFT